MLEIAGVRFSHLQFALISLGVGLRLSHYLSNRSLWHDEARLALNLTRRSMYDLLHPLDYGQQAPIGFLMIEKWAIELLGDNEFSLRLPPLVLSIVSLFLFKAVAEHLLKPGSVVLALGLFALCEPLIYYSAEVKQYSFDVACTLGSLLLGFRLLEDRRLTFTEIGLFSAIGSILIWLSHPSVFCLSGVGLVALGAAWFRRQQLGDLARLSLPLALWGCNFLLSYLVSLSRITQNAGLITYWQQAFLPLPPLSMSEVKILVHSFFSLMGQPVGTHSSGLAGFVFLLGAYGASQITKGRLCCLLFPGFVAILASALGKYPFSGRLTLFLVPIVITLIAAGSGAVFEALRSLPLSWGCVWFDPVLGTVTVVGEFLRTSRERRN